MRRGQRTLLATLTLTAGLVLAAGGTAAASGPVQAPGHVTAHGVRMQRLTGPHGTRGGSPGSVTSTSWAGYAATGGTGAFTSVASSWTEPAAHCTSGTNYASFWVGLDGYSDSSVEQIGSDADCSGKTPVYYAWYEMYPAAPVTFSNTVSAGDSLSASVTYAGSNQFTLKITDNTQGWSKTVSKSLAGAGRSSAEIIVEAPVSSGGVPQITDFGTVNFTGAMVNGSGLCKSNPTKITSPGLMVSPITNCTNFSVTQS